MCHSRQGRTVVWCVYTFSHTHHFELFCSRTAVPYLPQSHYEGLSLFYPFLLDRTFGRFRHGNCSNFPHLIRVLDLNVHLIWPIDTFSLIDGWN